MVLPTRPNNLNLLHLQLLLLVILPVASALLLLAIGGATIHERAMRELVGQRDSRATQVAANNLTERLHQREITLQLLSSYSENHSLVGLYTDELRQIFDYGFLLTDENGAILDTWLPNGGWEWRTASGGTPAFVGHNDREVVVVFSTLTSTGYLYGASSLEALGVSELVNSLTSSEMARAYLIDQDGHSLYDTGNTHILQTDYPPQAAFAALGGATGYQQSGELVIGYSSIPRLGWGLVVEEPWHAVTSSTLRLTHWILLAIICTLLLGLIIISYGLLAIVRPLHRLEQLAHQLSIGDFDSIQHPVGGIQEIRDLQTVLGKMAQTIKQAQTQLHGYIGAITTAQEDERHRLARDLHDDVVQSLIALNQQAQKAQRNIEPNPMATQQYLAQVRSLSGQIIQDIRHLIHDLRPTYLAELGLVPALEMLAEQNNTILIHCQVLGLTRRLTASVELALYRITQEALTNIRKHSHATAATIQVSFEADKVQLMVQDNGCGFEIPPLQRLSVQGHYGLVGIQERVQLIQGQLSLYSHPNQGTRLIISLSA